MRTRIARKVDAFFERFFPERRLFLRSDTDTRYIRLRPFTQAIAFAGVTFVLAWTIIATAVLLMDSIGSGNFREQAKRDQRTYEQRLNLLSAERDARALESQQAQERFNSALLQISVMQSQLLASETRRREMETGLDVVQSTLRKTMQARDKASREATELKTAMQSGGANGTTLGLQDQATIDMLTAALADTAQERDRVVSDAQTALSRAQEVELEMRLLEEKNDQIFRQLEDAMTISVEPLNKMFKKAGLSTDSLLKEVRRGYSGVGGLVMPNLSTMGNAKEDADAARANRILTQLDNLNLYRIAAQKAPFALPLKDPFRFTSGFGRRWGRMHEGTDFAAPHGTPIYSTADGTVVHAGWMSGYGNMVKIQHQFGIETRYGHMSKLRVKVGQKVSRGQRIGDMGNTGRSTGTHLHYEVRVGGRAVNPMIYIKAANDVF